MTTVEAYHALVADLYTSEAFLSAIEAERRRFGGLLTSEAIAHLLVDRAGRNRDVCIPLSRALPGNRVNVEGRVLRARLLDRGRISAAEVELSDDSGAARAVLSGDHVDLVRGGVVSEGARIRLLRATALPGSPLELAADRTTDVRVVTPAPAPRPADGATDPASLVPGTEDLTLSGRLVQVTPTRSFQRATGGPGFVADLVLEAAAGREIRITLWDEAVRAARALSPGSHVRVTGLRVRERNGAVSVSSSDATEFSEAGSG